MTHPSRLAALLLGAAAVSSAVAAFAASTPPLRLAAAGEATVRETASAAGALADSDRAPFRYRLVQFAQPPGRLQRERVAALGTILGYLPDHAFLVRLDDRVETPEAETLGALWVGGYPGALRVSPAALALAQRARADDATLRWAILELDPLADPAAVGRRLLALAGDRTGPVQITGQARGTEQARLGLLLPDRAIAALVAHLDAFPELLWLDLEPARRLLNDTTAWVGQSGLAGGQATPLYTAGINGAGQIVAVLDTGIDPNMCYFRETSGALPPANPCDGATSADTTRRKLLAVDFLYTGECSGGLTNSEWDTHGHGTHVAGTVAGDNLANGTRDTADGMAPGARLVIQDGGMATDDCADLPGIGCPVVDLKPIFLQTYDQGARIHSNSWGDNENAVVQNNYTAASRDVDQFMWEHPDFLLLFAAGNSGPGNNTVSSPSTAKNGLSVGATQRSTSAGSMASFSSCGWTDDQRYKPDLTVPGSSIVSAANDFNAGNANCGTTSMSGTSMATPGAAGFAALVRQYYADGFYPSGTATPADGFSPSAALVKATMLSSTVAMESVATPPPSRCQGWGRIKLDDALALGNESRRLLACDDRDGPASAGERRVATFRVLDASEPLRATLAWTDRPSTPAASVHLVSDLDLELLGPDGTFLGNVWSGGASVAGGSADRRNTVEQLRRLAPTPGLWAARVRAFALPLGAQPFALVVAGAIAPCIHCDELELDGLGLWTYAWP